MKRAVLYSVLSMSLSVHAAPARTAKPAEKPRKTVEQPPRTEPAISPLLFPLVAFDMQVKRAERPTTAMAMKEAKSRPCPGPEYPAGAMARGEQGVTRIAFRVDGEGWVESVKVIKSSGYAVLDEAAMSTIGGCWFEPSPDRLPMYAEQEFVWKTGVEKPAQAATPK